ncbi:MAG TPA: phytanoyl-CoA dioxygenase family protein, partial [Acidimicrobiales bacterium]
SIACLSLPVLTTEQIRQFATVGWIVVSGLVDDHVLNALDAEVDHLVAANPPSTGHVGPHFYWPSRGESAAFFDPLQSANGILAVAGELVGPSGIDVAFEQAQVALNIPPYDHRPARPHIDGYAPDQPTPGSFTLLAGLLLSDQTTDNGGNLWVWPGTHLSHGAFFAERGPQAFAVAEGYLDIQLPEPTQVRGRRGDVLFAHYLLGHNIGGNETDRIRRVIYWRLRATGHADRWAQCLTDPWLEFQGVGKHWTRDAKLNASDRRGSEHD